MKFLEVLVLLAVLIVALSNSVLAILVDGEELFFDDNEHWEKASLKGTSSVFLANSRGVKAPTCDKNPKMCRAASEGHGSNNNGGHGNDKSLSSSVGCCGKKCVDLKKDKLNCGKCGVKCKHGEICCNGRVVRPMSDKKNCGRCNNSCKKDSSCSIGMCSYA